jgi:hypothetical protein
MTNAHFIKEESDGTWTETDLHLPEEQELDFINSGYDVLSELCNQRFNMDSTFAVRSLLHKHK